MGQQPNIELDHEARPLQEPEPGPARRWKPSRPGEITQPRDMPWGGRFGTPGPDTGYALRLLRTADVPMPDPELQDPDVQAAVAAVAAARASALGRAPSRDDVRVALLLLGLDRSELHPNLIRKVAEARHRWVQGAAHDPAKGVALASAIPPAVLALDPVTIHHLMAAGDELSGLVSDE